MKRRPHGVNLDDGVALSTDEEFGLLFVDGRLKCGALARGGSLTMNRRQFFSVGRSARARQRC